MIPKITLDHIKQSLNLSDFDAVEAQAKLSPSLRPRSRDELKLPGAAREAATLVLLYPKDNELHFVLTKRRDDLPDHAGQISLPGGSREDKENFQQTALRETCEELGVCEPIQILGKLTDLYVMPSDFQVHPFVGYAENRPNWKIDPVEVSQVIETPLRLLFDESLKGWSQGEFRGMTFDYGWYDILGHKVWGATAIMLSEFEWRLRACF